MLCYVLGLQTGIRNNFLQIHSTLSPASSHDMPNAWIKCWVRIQWVYRAFRKAGITNNLMGIHGGSLKNGDGILGKRNCISKAKELGMRRSYMAIINRKVWKVHAESGENIWTRNWTSHPRSLPVIVLAIQVTTTEGIQVWKIFLALAWWEGILKN